MEQDTLIGEAGVSDEVWETAAAEFDEATLVQVLMAISVINVRNRLAIATHMALPEDP